MAAYLYISIINSCIFRNKHFHWHREHSSSLHIQLYFFHPHSHTVLTELQSIQALNSNHHHVLISLSSFSFEPPASFQVGQVLRERLARKGDLWMELPAPRRETQGPHRRRPRVDEALSHQVSRRLTGGQRRRRCPSPLVPLPVAGLLLTAVYTISDVYNIINNIY